MKLLVDCIGISPKTIHASYGIYRYIKTLLSTLKQSSFDINLIIVTDEESSAYYEDLTTDTRFTLNRVCMDIAQNKNFICALKGLLTELGNNNRDHILFVPRGYFITKCTNKKVVTIHDTIPHFYWKHYRKLKSFVIWNRIVRSIKQADKVLFVSNTSFCLASELLCKKTLYDKAVVSYNAIDKDFFDFSMHDESKKDYFVTFYHNIEHKGFNNVKKAFLNYRARGGGNELYAIGKSDQNDSEAINYIKLKDDWELRRLYSNCKGFISSSLIEGFGLPVVEAAIYNKWLILSNIPVYREIIGEYKNSIFVNPYLPDQLEKALFKADSSPPENDDSFSEIIRSKYGQERQLDEFIDCLKNIN